MRVGDYSHEELEHLLRSDGLRVQFGPFTVCVYSDIELIPSITRRLYAPYPSASSNDFVDFHVGISRPRSIRRWFRQQSLFSVDRRVAFAPYPTEHAFPALEWGINWCIATRAHHLLMLHSAVVERNGKAMLLPAWPGHGKSTLCSALIHTNWRLLSDEFGLVRPEDGLLLPLPRLIPLKNESIDVIGRFCADAFIGPSFIGTRKGTVAHVRPPDDSILRAHEPAEPRWLVFPRWVENAALDLEPLPKSEAFVMVAANAFNYEVLDETSFRLVAEIVNRCDSYSLVYSDLQDAISAIDKLTEAGDA
jgi:HprK-related kinase A